MRPRKKDRNLPACMYHKHGAYYYVRGGKWTRLGKELPAALQEYARLTTAPQSGVAELIDRVLEDAERKNTKGDLADNTLKQYRIAAAKVKTAFVEFSPEQVTAKHIKEFMDAYRHTPNMANRCRSLLKMAFDEAVQMEVCSSNPVISIPRHKERERDRYITDEEYDRLKAVASPVLACIMDLAYLTGQRISDVLAIRLSDITEDGVLMRQQKTRQRMLIAMTPELQDAIDRAKALHGATPKMYLLAQRNGRIRSYRGVRDLFVRYAEKAGVEDVGLHDLRAKAVTDAKSQGLDPTALAGHRSPSQTVRYIRSKETMVVSGPSFRQSNTSKKTDLKKV